MRQLFARAFDKGTNFLMAYIIPPMLAIGLPVLAFLVFNELKREFFHSLEFGQKPFPMFLAFPLVAGILFMIVALPATLKRKSSYSSSSLYLFFNKVLVSVCCVAWLVYLSSATYLAWGPAIIPASILVVMGIGGMLAILKHAFRNDLAFLS